MTAKQPVLTYYLPVYNAVPFLDALFANLEQLPENRVHFLFVDDVSKDESLARIQKFAEGRANVSVYAKPENGGEGSTSNYAIERVTTPYFGRLDPDDLLDVAETLKLLDALEESSSDLVLTGIRRTNLRGEEALLILEEPLPASTQELLNYYWKAPTFGHQGILVSRDLAQRHRLRFGTSTMGLDVCWALRAMAASESYTRVHAFPYHYIMREGSASVHEKKDSAKEANKRRRHIHDITSLGWEQVKAGLLEPEVFHEHMRDAGRKLMRAYRRAGQQDLALGCFFETRRHHGEDHPMRRELKRSAWLGVPKFSWQVLLSLLGRRSPERAPY